MFWFLFTLFIGQGEPKNKLLKNPDLIYFTIPSSLCEFPIFFSYSSTVLHFDNCMFSFHLKLFSINFVTRCWELWIYSLSLPYGVQAHTRCHAVPAVPSASHEVPVPSGFITWYQLFRVWCAQPPPTKAWLPPKWLVALYPIESMMLRHVATLVAASWSCIWEESG